MGYPFQMEHLLKETYVECQALFSKLVRRNRIPLRSSPLPLDQIRSLFFFQKMFEKVKDVPGSIVECGIGYGRSFLLLAALIHEERKKRTLYGFDSFEGFPNPSEEDSGPRNATRGEYGDISKKQVLKLLSASQFPQPFLENFCHITEGFFDETLVQYRGGPIALLHLDVDLYQSYKTCLEILFPQMAPGGIIIFDEYHQKTVWPGAKKAVDEFFEDQGIHIYQELTTKKCYCFKDGFRK